MKNFTLFFVHTESYEEQFIDHDEAKKKYESLKRLFLKKEKEFTVKMMGKVSHEDNWELMNQVIVDKWFYEQNQDKNT